jgi:diketogulonate reductase-like aldo/keto reductase
MRSVTVQGVAVPWILYGTAWKEERTAPLTTAALAAGFRGIDTANQRKHYFEEGVGHALANAGVARDALFLQSKFTYARGQDHRLPYDPAASLAEQVEQSFASSLAHLGVDRLDALLLHGPEHARGLTAGDRAVWGRFEDLHRRGAVGLLGVSNVGLDQLDALWTAASIKPALVQNRCYARDGWDREIRAWCRAHDVGYQGFSLLTANRAELGRPAVHDLARRRGCTVPELVFAFARQVGIIVLTGTSDPLHLRQDLAAADLVLTDDELPVLTE